jgi:hypothetical protein
MGDHGSGDGQRLFFPEKDWSLRLSGMYEKDRVYMINSNAPACRAAVLQMITKILV